MRSVARLIEYGLYISLSLAVMEAAHEVIKLGVSSWRDRRRRKVLPPVENPE